MARGGIGPIHKDVVAYGRQLIRRGWTELDEDAIGNPRYAWDGSPAVLTLNRYGYGRWRQEADDLAAHVSGQRRYGTGRSKRPGRLEAVPDSESLTAIAQRVNEAHRQRHVEERRRRLRAAERSFNFYRNLMSQVPGR